MQKEKAHHTLSFDTIAELVNFLGKLKYGYFYRGVPDYKFELKSKLQRVLEDNQCDAKLWYAKEIFSINYFKQQFKTIDKNCPEDEDIFNWLCLMQHYGAPTRLIDWTLSPYVALFFAYTDIDFKKEKDGALWIINPEVIKAGILQRRDDFHNDLININRFLAEEEGGKNRDSFEKQNDVLKRINLLLIKAMTGEHYGNLPISGFYSDARLIAQQGCFTIQLNLSQNLDRIPIYSPDNSFNGMQENVISFTSRWTSIEDILGNPNLTQFLKIKLPFNWKNQILEMLAKMNVSAANLFPGLAGIGLATQNHLIFKTVQEGHRNFVDTSVDANELMAKWAKDLAKE